MPTYNRCVAIPGKSSQDLYRAVSNDIDGYVTKASIQCRIYRYPEQEELRIYSSMFSATLLCREARIEVRAKLSLLALPFKKNVDQNISRWLSKTFQLS